VSLQEKARLRKEMGLFVVEGRRELEHCLDAGYEVNTVFYCPDIFGKGATPLHSWICSDDCKSLLVQVPAELYSKIAYRDGTEGIIAEVRSREHSLDSLCIRDNPLIVVLEGVEKPGNLGAVLRSADACGADAVLVCDPLTDIYNPNLIRSSIGAVFTVPVVSCSSKDAICWLKERKVKIFTAQLQDSKWYYDTDMKQGIAIVIGTEATGLTQVWRDAAAAHIKIPMLGKLDSLNASVSAAILLYEAVRQRHG